MAIRPIGSLGAIPTLQIAGSVFTDLTNIQVLWAYTVSQTRSVFKKINASTGYAVTTGKTLNVTGYMTFATSLTYFIFVSADSDIGFDTATAFTNPVYEVGGSTLGLYGNETTAAPLYKSTIFTVPALKYMNYQSPGSNQVKIQAFGYEY